MAIAMNQSLSPTKLDSTQPPSPSNYPDKRSYVAAYKRMVKRRKGVSNMYVFMHSSYYTIKLHIMRKQCLICIYTLLCVANNIVGVGH